jgi:hypothetical protein
MGAALTLPLPFASVSDVTARRDISREPRPEGGGIESFDTDAAIEINEARLAHLGSLGLPLDGPHGAGGRCRRRASHRLLRRARLLGRRHRGAGRECRGAPSPVADGRCERSRRRREPPAPRKVRRRLLLRRALAPRKPPPGSPQHGGRIDDLFLIETMVCDSDLPVLLLEDEPESSIRPCAASHTAPAPDISRPL